MPTDEADCTECGSPFFTITSAMADLCSECSHLLYGYPRCEHQMQSGRCSVCGWNGSRSAFTGKLG